MEYTVDRLNCDVKACESIVKILENKIKNLKTRTNEKDKIDSLFEAKFADFEIKLNKVVGQVIEKKVDELKLVLHKNDVPIIQRQISCPFLTF